MTWRAFHRCGQACSLHVVERVEHTKLYVDVHLACDTAARTAFAAGVSVTFTDGTQSVLGLVNPPAKHSLMGHEAYTVRVHTSRRFLSRDVLLT